MTWGSSPLVPIQTGLISLFKERRNRYITLSWLPWFLDLNKPWSCRYDRKYDTYDFPVHDYTQMAVSVKKDCCDPEILLPW